MSSRQTQSFISQRLQEAGVRPQLQHGQNFLIDLNLVDLIVRTANLGSSDVVLEVGTGLGSLTSRMAELAAGVVTVEIDPRLFALASEELAGLSNVTMLHPAIGDVRPYPGLCFALERLRGLLEGSYLWETGSARNLQDPLTFRCLPQIHGATRDALDFTKRQLEIELNASQENPLVIPDEDRIVSVANFDILPLAAALDFLRVALAPALTSACERMLKLLQGPLTGLPDGLAPRQGLAENSLGEFGVAAQALTAEARLLASPVSYE